MLFEQCFPTCPPNMRPHGVTIDSPVNTSLRATHSSDNASSSTDIVLNHSAVKIWWQRFVAYVLYFVLEELHSSTLK